MSDPVAPRNRVLRIGVGIGVGSIPLIGFNMSPNRRIFLNIVVTNEWSRHNAN